MHTHSQWQIWMRFQSTANLQGAFNRFLRTSVEDERHAIAPGAFNQSASRIRLSESLGTPDNLVQPITQSALLINRVPRVTYDVHEQDIGDLELNLLLSFGRHVLVGFIHTLRCSVEEIKIDNHASQGCCGDAITVVAGVPPAKLRNCSRHGCLYRFIWALTR
jgi:hypothetical protein